MVVSVACRLHPVTRAGNAQHTVGHGYSLLANVRAFGPGPLDGLLVLSSDHLFAERKIRIFVVREAYGSFTNKQVRIIT